MAALDLDQLDALCTPPRARRLFHETDHHEHRDWDKRWDALCKLVVQPGWDKGADQWMERAERALEAWPDAARTWPHAWFRRKVTPRATRLVRSLRLGEQKAATHSAIFAQLATLNAETMPALTELRLDIHKPPTSMLDAAQVALLLDRLALTPLADLHISGGDSSALWAALADAPALRTVRRFGCALYKNPHVTRDEYDEGFERLLASPHARALEQLDISSDELPREARLPRRAVELLIAHHAARITHLIWPPCRDAELSALCDAHWPALRVLRTTEAMTLEQLARRIDHAPALEELAVWSKLSGAPAPAGQATGLRTVDLLQNDLSAAQAAALLADPRLAGVERLTMNRVPCDARGVRALLSMPLVKLRVEQPDLDMMWPMLRGQRLERLRTLFIEAGSLGDVLSLDLPALTRVLVKLPGLTMQDLDALERAPWYAQLEGLSIYWPFEYPLQERLLAMTRKINHPAA